MSINLTIELVCNFSSVVICSFLSIQLCFFARGDRTPNILIGFFLFYTGLSVMHSMEQIEYSSHWFLSITRSFDSPYLFASILFFYSFSITKTWEVNFKKYKWMLYVILFDILSSLFIHLVMPESDILVSIKEVFSYISILFTVGILILMIRLIKSHNNNILSFFSSIENKQLNWLRLLAVVNIGFIFFWAIDDSLRIFIGENLVSTIIAELSLYATLINILWVGYSSLNQIPIDNFDPSTSENPNNKNLNNQNNRVAAVDELNTYKSILSQMGEHKYFLDPKLSLRTLSDALNFSEKELSRIINICSGNNFFHFINSFRIEHFKKLYRDENNSNMSILGLAQESGFKSKSTFYTAFKKIEGRTPKQFQTEGN